jgi:hypothetical protein
MRHYELPGIFHMERAGIKKGPFQIIDAVKGRALINL